MKACYFFAIAIAIMGCAFAAAQSTPYLLQLQPAFSDGWSSIYAAKSELLDWQIAVATLGPCAARVPHYHTNADELLYVTYGTIVYINVEANNTFTRGEATPGYVIEQPKGGYKVLYNPTCDNATVTVKLGKATPITYDIPYAIPSSGDFTLDATWYPRPQLRYANSKSPFTYNPECLAKCNIKLPSDYVDTQYTQYEPTQKSG